MKKIINFFLSKIFFLLLIIIYIIALAIATFLEEKYSTETAQAIIYYSKWFEIIMLLLVINFIGNIKKYKLFNLKKWPILTFHISFLFIILGGGISRYFGFDGTLLIREGNKSNHFFSKKKYLQINLSDNNKCSCFKQNYIISDIHNHFEKFFYFKNNIFLIKLENYLKNVKEIFINDKLGEKYINIITINNNISKYHFIQSGSLKEIEGYYISFNKHVKGIINIYELNNKIYIETPLNLKSELKLSYIYNIYNFKFFIKSKPILVKKYLIPINNKYNLSNYPSYINGFIYKQNLFKKFDILISKNFKLIKNKINFLGNNISITYGPIELELPFFVKLKKFILEKYPGSLNPSFFKSELQIIYGNKINNFYISMNNIFDYKGYRFFQSGYNSDEKGTILYINHDFWGYNISYFGYLILIISVFFISFCKNSRFGKLKSQFK
ncbi:cytochrome c biogenesis protein ResB [Candidatus Karelsulcia muelleri]|uniref:cytochrome c biogenesis protein ResB n=1 Tax=Candidatus Karelsulcia muelleri TaxID=336810 RepID=UPI00059735A0|nr:cytochrome c biogenesis protein ResB [Candidatus Karelsulcia muelleri]NJJ98674.1 cytochrome c biogenesis protein ResB [Candidatus Karelsulcia muelleri]